MTPDKPPMKREDLEAKVTALLLGELPADEAALLRELIARDAGLARLHDRLKPTLALLRETIATAEVAPAVPPKLSPERREKLLAQFKTVAPKEFAPSPKRIISWPFALTAVASLVILACLTLPTLSGGKRKGQDTLGSGRAEKRPFLGLRWFQREEEKPLASADPIAAPASPPAPIDQAQESVGKTASLAEQQQAEPAANQIVLPTPGAETAQSYVPNATPHSETNTFIGRYAYVVLPEFSPAPLSSPALSPATPTATPEPGLAAERPLNGEVEWLGLLRQQPQALLGGDRNVGQATNAALAEQNFGFSAAVEAKSSANLNAYKPPSESTIVLPTSSSAPGTAADTATEPNWVGGVKNDFYSLQPPALQTDVAGPGGSAPRPGQNFRGGRYGGPAAGGIGGLGGGGGGNGQSIGGTIPQVRTAPVNGSVPSLGEIPVVGALLADKESKSANSTSAADSLGNGQIGSSNFYVDKDTGQTFVLADGQTTGNASQVVSNPGVSIRGVGGIVLDDAKKIEPQGPSALKPVVIPIKYASAGDIASALNALGANGGTAVGRSTSGANFGGTSERSSFQNNLSKSVQNASVAGGSQSLADTKIIADERSNSLLIFANDDDKKKIEGILKKLDVATAQAASPQPGQKTEVAGNGQSIGGTIPQVAIASVEQAGQQGRDGQQQNFGPSGRQIGLSYVTRTNTTVEAHQKVVAYFAALGVNLAPPKAIFFNDQSGQLLVRGTQQDLEIVQQAIAMLDKTEPQATSEAKADETSQSLGLYNKTFRVNPTTFLQGVQKVTDVTLKFGSQTDAALARPAVPPPVPQPEVLTSTNIFSTFSLNVSDASFKLAAASLQNGVMPEAASIRSEEFINAFDYRDPEPVAGAPIGFAWERAGYPFAHHRDLLRFSVKTAAQGRPDGRPLNLVLLLDKSGSMERADRVEIIQQALRVLASQLHAQDTLSVVVFARTARLWVDGVPGSQAGDVANGLSRLTPEGGTNLEEAMRLAYETALRHYQAKGDNRVVLLTDGAANLGEVNPEKLQQKVEANRQQGIALDCFGVGWDGYNDNLMDTLSRAGHGRYGFINSPEEAATEFAGKLAGALRVAASDVKVQVEFNPNRVTAYRQIGYARHQLTKEQFRDNSVAAAQIGAAESGNALYTVEVNAAGDGPLCTVRVRFRLPGTTDYQEHAWDVPYTGTTVTLDQASPAMRLAATASAFSEWLAASPYAGEVTPDLLLAELRGVPEVYGADTLPKKLEWMIHQAKSIAGK
jgi:Mg-chelatase subunit ChlD